MTWLIVMVTAVLMMFLLTVIYGAPYVPSKRRDVALSFDELYSIGSADTLVDLGSGDGVVLREAARRGAQAIGYEVNPILVWIGRLLSRGQPKVSVRQANYLRVSLPEDTTIVYLFGESYHIAQISKWLTGQAEHLEKTFYVMSYGFTLPDRTPIRTLRAHHLYLIEPLQVKGA